MVYIKRLKRIFLIILSFSCHLHAQDKFTISGYLRDSTTTETLIGASVFDAKGNGTVSNAYGFYSITLPAGETGLTYSFVGYKKQVKTFLLNRDTLINISLAGSLLLEEVEIVAERNENIRERTQMSHIRLPVKQVRSLPAFLGETDLLKTLHLLPGVQSGGEGSTGLYIRGGGADQNLIILDGVPVYNISHLFGFFSIFNSDAIHHVELYKGGFPARYGGRISSVVDISMKEGNMQEFHLDGSIGLISAKLTFGGPVVKDKTSFIISARRTYADLFSNRLISKLSERDDLNIRGGYYFYDVNVKINHRFSDKDRIFFSTYTGKDKFHVKVENSEEDIDYLYRSQNISGLEWGNLTATVRWNHVFSAKLFGNTSLLFSKYLMDISNSMNSSTTIAWQGKDTTFHSIYSMKFHSGIIDAGLKTEFDYRPDPSHHLRFGGNLVYHVFDPGATGVNDAEQAATMGSEKIRTWEYSLYAEDDFKVSEAVKINAGLHYSGFYVRNKFYQSVQPRISLRWLLNATVSLKTAYSRMAQFIHLLTNTGLGLPSDLWVPSTAMLKPQFSDQVAVGLAYELKKGYEFTVEGYYKTMKNVVEYVEGSSVFDLKKQWENRVVQGEGQSYGMELFFNKTSGSLTGWMGYTLSWSDRLFDELNNGKRFSYKYDRRHDFSIIAVKKIRKNIELSGTWVFGTGNCYTIPENILTLKSTFIQGGEDNQYLEYSERNSFRMAPYHRLDVSVSFSKKKRWGERKWVISIYNLYNRKNPYFIDVEERQRSINESGATMPYYSFMQYSLFPVIPSVSYQFSF